MLHHNMGYEVTSDWAGHGRSSYDFIALSLIRRRLERLERFPERFQCIKRRSLGCLPSGTVSRGVDEAIS